MAFTIGVGSSTKGKSRNSSVLLLKYCNTLEVPFLLTEEFTFHSILIMLRLQSGMERKGISSSSYLVVFTVNRTHQVYAQYATTTVTQNQIGTAMAQYLLG